VPKPPRTIPIARALRTRRLAALGLLAVVAGLALPAGPAAATPDGGVRVTAAAPAPATATTGSPVVLVGVTGLRWDDIGSITTPALWGTSRQGAVGTTVVRSVRTSSCPADGWLAVSTGTRAADRPAGDATCRQLLDPAPGSPVPGWADYEASAASGSYSAHVGLLGDTLATGGATVTGIGPGAAIALARSNGQPVGTHRGMPSDPAALTRLVSSALVTSALVVVDAGSVRDPGYAVRDRGATGAATTDTTPEPTRGAQVQAIDTRVRAVLAAIDSANLDPTVLVVSLADSGPVPQLQLAVARGPGVESGAGRYASALLGSESTRQPGLVQTSDLTPTILAALGLRADAPTGALIGSSITAVPGPTVASTRVAAMIDTNRHAQAVRPIVAAFYLMLLGINLVLCLLVAFALNAGVLRRWGHAGALSRPVRVLRPLRVAAVAVATIPVATFLANLVPWWRTAHPSFAVAGAVAGWVVVITALTLLPRRRERLLAPLGTVAAITALVISVDVATGARLQLASLMGPQTLVAGRFYGFNNTAFVLVAVASILLAATLATPLVARGRRGLAAWVVAAIGVVTTALDGLPSVGADLGGPPALVPGFAVLALLIAGVRVTWRRAVGVLAAAAAVVIAFAVADWLRPADSRTHLGRFVQTVLDGGAWQVVDRKLQANVGALGGGVPAVLAVVALIALVMALRQPVRKALTAPDGGSYGWLSARTPLDRLGTDAPTLRPALIALTVTLVIGFAVNDSGILILGIGAALAVPLLTATWANWLLHLRPDEEPVPA
jgi:hypothetical protein